MTTPASHSSTAQIAVVQQSLEDLAKLPVRNVLVDAGTGFRDGMKIVFIFEDGRMQRPLAAAPRSALVHFAAILIEDAMAIDRLHLHRISRHSPIHLSDRVFASMQGLDHTHPIVGVKGNGGLAMTAIAASRTGKDSGDKRHTLHHGKKNQQTAKTSIRVGIEENTSLRPDFH
jgi:hypothetical protein